MKIIYRKKSKTLTKKEQEELYKRQGYTNISYSGAEQKFYISRQFENKYGRL